MKFCWLIWLLNIAIPTLGSEGQDTLRARKLYDRGDSLHRLAQYDSAIVYFTLAADLFHNQDLAWRLRSLNKLADANTRVNDYEESRRICKEVLKRSRELSVSSNLIMADAYNSLGSISLSNEDFDSALLHYSKSYDLRVQSLGKYDAIVAGSLNNLGLTQKRLGDYEKALELMGQALNIAELARDSANQAR